MSLLITNFLFVLVCFNQMGAVESSFDEIPNIFDTGGSKGLPGDSVEKIPKIKITCHNNVDASGEKVSCSVCLQVKNVMKNRLPLTSERISLSFELRY